MVYLGNEEDFSNIINFVGHFFFFIFKDEILSILNIEQNRYVFSEELVGEDRIKLVDFIDKENGHHYCIVDGDCTYIVGKYHVIYTGMIGSALNMDKTKTGDIVEIFGELHSYIDGDGYGYIDIRCRDCYLKKLK